MKKDKPHILVVSQYFYPEQFRINDMAAEWVKRGYEVTVLTGIPNYPRGKFYKGYSWRKRRRETWNGIDIRRIPLFARGRTSFGMVLNYISFVISGWFWKAFTKLRADMVFTFEVSPMTQALVGCWYAKKHKIPHYLYVQDLWPQNVKTVSGIKTPLIIKPIDKMVKYIYDRSDKILAASPGFLKSIKMRAKCDEKVMYWPQYAEDFYKPAENASVPEIPQNGTFKIAFTGNIGFAQGLDVLPKVAKKLKDEDIQFVIVGDGRYKEGLLRQAEGVLDKFIMIDRQPPERIPEILSCCDVAFISFMDTEIFGMTIPAKLQSYMACGMPIVAAAYGETVRIIDEAGCGLCCDIGDIDALAENILKLKNSDLSQMKKNARAYFEANFDKKKLMDEMDLLFEEAR
ncbi:MAG: glycosyltransferase family 4 protein [Clostridia bacterium]|nr:glycosyltransferase family 4 protein [Clostridia bacterium]